MRSEAEPLWVGPLSHLMAGVSRVIGVLGGLLFGMFGLALASSLAVAYVWIAGFTLLSAPGWILDYLHSFESATGPWRFYWFGAALTGSGLIVAGWGYVRPRIREWRVGFQDFEITDLWTALLATVYLIPIGLTLWLIACFAWPLTAWLYAGETLLLNGVDL